ncbi:MAG: hypothetical protein CVU52_04875 [Deltaproteobacteria bacterium HGW-Deltaproteobacteria-10]|nr:MAG: hypothetical protein CVU52_04875 [Deltaproteobacteria bacterium HGW-Deltaproteobacteria-10]
MSINNLLREIKNHILSASLQSAVKEQGLKKKYEQLSEIVPDISKQYSGFELNTPYLITNVRSMHAFQISLVEWAMQCLKIGSDEAMTIVDIGDSAGTHLQYIQALYKNIRALSVNLDNSAVQKIKGKGLEAIQARAEELELSSVNADIFLSFEMLEHLSDPINFLKKLSVGSQCKAFIVTIPYLQRSRIGLHHIRGRSSSVVSAESTHIFELSPHDWKLIFMHTGWSVCFDKIYLQYPKYGLLRLTKSIWKKFDFEGFYGAVLVRDNTYSKLDKDW